MIEWLTEFRTAADGVTSGAGAIVTLATANARGAPMRSVVCRRVDDDGSLWIVSDARSEKNAQLRARPKCEIVCWLAGPRVQFRFRGEAELLTSQRGGSARLQLWRSLKDESRALFFWPAPGEPRSTDESAFPKTADAAVAPPDSFEVIVVRPVSVESLSLNSHPHRRQRWSVDDGWRVQELNP